MTTHTVCLLPERTPAGAAVWVNGRHAMVAKAGLDGRVTTVDVERGIEPETSYLARVVQAIGDRKRVVVLGPSSRRLALEREYVALFKRPERLVDVEVAGPTDPTALAKRLTSLVA